MGRDPPGSATHTVSPYTERDEIPSPRSEKLVSVQKGSESKEGNENNGGCYGRIIAIQLEALDIASSHGGGEIFPQKERTTKSKERDMRRLESKQDIERERRKTSRVDGIY